MTLRLEIEALSGGWGAEAVLRDVSLGVDLAGGGCLLPIMGRTGAGKSTLLSIIAALKTPMAGRVRWTIGDETLDLTPGARFGPEVARFRNRHFATVFQDLGLMPWLTLGENVALFLRQPGRAGHGRAAAMLDQLAVAGEADRRALHVDAFPHQLSGGQRQRVAVAMALAAGPSVLFADEPTGSLDATSRAEVMRMLHGWALLDDRPRALVWITHDATDPALTAARQMLILRDTVHLQSCPAVIRERRHACA